MVFLWEKSKQRKRTWGIRATLFVLRLRNYAKVVWIYFHAFPQESLHFKGPFTHSPTKELRTFTKRPPECVQSRTFFQFHAIGPLFHFHAIQNNKNANHAITDTYGGWPPRTIVSLRYFTWKLFLDFTHWNWDAAVPISRIHARKIRFTQSRKTIWGSGVVALWRGTFLPSPPSILPFPSPNLIWDEREASYIIHLAEHPSHTIGMRNPFTRQRITSSWTKDSSPHPTSLTVNIICFQLFSSSKYIYGELNLVVVRVFPWILREY